MSNGVIAREPSPQTHRVHGPAGCLTAIPTHGMLWPRAWQAACWAVTGTNPTGRQFLHHTEDPGNQVWRKTGGAARTISVTIILSLSEPQTYTNDPVYGAELAVGRIPRNLLDTCLKPSHRNICPVPSTSQNERAGGSIC